MIFSLSKFPFRSFTFSRLLVSYKKILSTYFYSANSFSSVSVGFPFVSGFYCLHAFLSFRINLFKLAFFLNMKIIFAFRTRLSFLSKEKTLYTICYAVVNLLLALRPKRQLRIFAYRPSEEKLLERQPIHNITYFNQSQAFLKKI